MYNFFDMNQYRLIFFYFYLFFQDFFDYLNSYDDYFNGIVLLHHSSYSYKTCFIKLQGDLLEESFSGANDNIALVLGKLDAHDAQIKDSNFS